MATCPQCAEWRGRQPDRRAISKSLHANGRTSTQDLTYGPVATGLLVILVVGHRQCNHRGTPLSGQSSAQWARTLGDKFQINGAGETRRPD